MPWVPVVNSISTPTPKCSVPNERTITVSNMLDYSQARTADRGLVAEPPRGVSARGRPMTIVLCGVVSNS